MANLAWYGSGDTGGRYLESTGGIFRNFYAKCTAPTWSGLPWGKSLYTWVREWFAPSQTTPYSGQLYPNGSNSNPVNGQNYPF